MRAPAPEVFGHQRLKCAAEPPNRCHGSARQSVCPYPGRPVSRLAAAPEASLGHPPSRRVWDIRPRRSPLRLSCQSVIQRTEHR